MKRLLIALTLCLFVCGLSSCVSGPSYKEVAERIPPVPEHQGRIFFFRPDSFVGGGVQPDIKIDGQVVGSSKPGGFFFVDRPAGTYKVACSTEAENVLTLELEEQQIRYVKTTVSMGFFVGHVTPELVEPAEGEKALRELKYTGPDLAAPKASP